MFWDLFWSVSIGLNSWLWIFAHKLLFSYLVVSHYLLSCSWQLLLNFFIPQLLCHCWFLWDRARPNKIICFCLGQLYILFAFGFRLPWERMRRILRFGFNLYGMRNNSWWAILIGNRWTPSLDLPTTHHRMFFFLIFKKLQTFDRRLMTSQFILRFSRIPQIINKATSIHPTSHQSMTIGMQTNTTQRLLRCYFFDRPAYQIPYFFSWISKKVRV